MKYTEFVLGELKARRLSKTQARQLLYYAQAGQREGLPAASLLQHRSTSALHEDKVSSTFSDEEFDLGDRATLLTRVWESSPVSASLPVEYSERYVFIDPIYKEFIAELEAQAAAVKWLVLSGEEPAAERLIAAGEQVFSQVQSILQSKPKQAVLLQVLLGTESEFEEATTALSGLLKSASLENPTFSGQVMVLSRSATVAELVQAANENASAAKNDAEIRYVDGVRAVTRFKELSESATATTSRPWKDGGVYLITGGAGGLGLIMAREIVAQVKQAKIILTGRSPVSEATQAAMQTLQDQGHETRIEYRVLDVSDAAAVRMCVHSLLEQYGSLNGIVHSAGVIKDNFIIKKTSDEFRSVLAPKVLGTVNLDCATQSMALDCFILFSSNSGVFGNVGQSDYALANAFMDRYAAYRNQLIKTNHRQGRTLSINWPLWADGGMQVDDATQAAMRRQGFDVLATADGVAALYRAWSSDASQVMVLAGDRRSLEALAQVHTRTPTPRAALKDQLVIDSSVLRERTLHRLKQLFGGVTKLGVERIDEQEPLESYGIDSIMIVQLNQKLGEVFSELPKTLFYEYPSLSQLSEYLLSERQEECIRWSGLQPKSPLPVANHQSVAGGMRTREQHRTRFASRRVSTPVAREGIAVIGISGRYPGANTLNEYWENLKSGKDCISEIPSERWPLSGFYEEDAEKAVASGKSYSKWGGFIEGFAEFDSLFFNISPREAANMDPQERLFLQASWEVLEDAGYTRESLAKQYQGRVGVYAGITKTGFDLYGPELWQRGEMAYPHTSFSSVANRVSYLLDLHGPSMPIDTMCSASLTAIHEACEHLLRDECELAIAGGVNLYLHPSSYASLCAAGMLSRDGECKSFGQGGNGYVPGEGVGAVLLKSLSKAIADDDHIYGVIKGTSINHGGKTNGYTVPNPNSQRELIEATLKKAKIDPRRISYIEAHGTGTELGDPIEMTGLTQAFARHTQDKQFCALGSVKTNIGHLESAAGIAGVTKVLLQMQHRMLVPSLHSATLNPHIDFSRTPFKVQQTAEEWRRPLATINGQEQEYPRIAGISSFGAGGANAHVIVEEYVAADNALSAEITPEHPALMVLSAKSEVRLQAQAKQLLAHVSAQALTNAALPHIAYTLQVGREPMEHRLAFTAVTIKELTEKLTGYIEGKVERGEIEACYRGEVKKNKDALSIFNTDDALQLAIASWVAQGKYAKLLELWVKGLVFDWAQLYGEGSAYAAMQPKRISLPTYPFAKERYWVEANKLDTVRRQGSSVLHPLLQRNTSDLNEQRFSSTFVGEEFYLNDHVVDGSKVLPGVAYLEMARAAVERSAGLQSVGTVVTLKNVVWMRPVVVSEAKEVHIALSGGDHGEIEFEIYSVGQDATSEEIIHAQGQAVLVNAESTESEPIDLSLLRSQCDQVIDVAQCYAVYSAMGMEYGPAHRGLTSVQVGTDADGQRFVLAQVRLPACVSDTQDQYVLHPSALDSALQASIGFSLGSAAQLSEGVNKAALPFALETLQILDRTLAEAMVVVRPNKTASTTPASSGIQKLDIELCDESGRVCVSLRGFASRVLEADLNQSRGVIPESRTLLLTPNWEATPLLAAGSSNPVEYSERYVFIDPIYKEYLGELEGQSAAVKWSVLPGEGPAAERLMAAGEQVFSQVQSILQSKPKQAVLLQVLLGTESEFEEATTALSGLLKSASLENPTFSGQVMVLSRSATVAELVQAANENASAAKNDAEIRYVDGVRAVTRFKELSESATATTSRPWKDGGVYLITGGAGGLGLIMAREIVAQVKQAKIILTGRSPVSEATQAAMQTLQDQGHETRIEYRVLDVSDAAAVRMCVHSLLEQYGSLNGIVHSAGVIKDNFIIKKTSDEFRSVLAPKVLGTVNLDCATQSMALDCFILFSSNSGVFGNVGQSDYALANAFMDRYAAYRNQLIKTNHRQGRTLSINWPLWADGGMQVDDATQAAMRRQGFDVLATADGVAALYRAWSSDASQVMVLAGDRRSLEALAQVHTRTPTPRAALKDQLVIDSSVLRERTLHRLKQLFGGVTKLGVERIDEQEPLESYGIDSIMIVQLNQKLGEVFSELPKTLFYEYPSLSQLSEYLLSERQEECIRWSGLQPKSPLPVANHQSVAGGMRTREQHRTRFASRRVSTPVAREGIAVIGISGRYPGANTLNEYWENLKSGKDCISEIPSERWPLSGFYEEDAEKAVASGKSYSKWGGFIEGFAEFDSLFFNISPREAANMDPQERLFLQASWEVLEDAGYTRESLAKQYQGRVGVYAGITKTGFDLYGPELWQRGEMAYPHTSFSSVANRVSYLLDLHGPSMPIDTMCSASLTAIHEACAHLLRDECELAIAGGVNLYLHPSSYASLCAAGMLSRDGECKSFGQGGNGYVPGEGVGAVLLKSLSKAIADDDHIYGVIKGTSINHGGKTNGYTVPNPNSQRELIEATLKKAKIDPRRISYIEAHGTGTELGDPIEMTGLTQAFARHTQDKQFCALGSVKTNIGHLESAAGIAGVTKVLLQMQHRMLVPSLHSATLNPHIDFERTPFRVQQDLAEWTRPSIEHNGERKEYPRTAGISSFGAGGANAHVIIEEYVAADDAHYAVEITPDHPALIVLSAKSEERLQAQVKRLLAHLNANSYTDADLGSTAYTLQVGREAMEQRLALSVTSMAMLKEKLIAYSEGKDTIEGCYRGEVKRNKDTSALFTADEDLQKAIEAWIGKGKYGKLLELWVKGVAVNWMTLYGESPFRAATKPTRLSLPTYPFAKDRYWMRTSLPTTAVEQRNTVSPTHISHSSDESSGAAMVDAVLLAPFWEATVPPATAAWPSADSAVLLVGGTQRQQHAWQAQYSRLRVLTMEDDPSVETMAERIQALGSIDQVVWLAPANRLELITDESLIEGQAEGVIELYRLIKALLLLGYGARSVGFSAVTWQTQAVIRGERIDPTHASVHGLMGSLAKEYVNWSIRLVDLPIENSDAPMQALIGEVLRLPADPQGDAWAYRQGEWYRQQLVPCELSAASTTVYRQGGVYVVIGGAGGLGEVFSEHLIKHYQAQMVWIGRREVDADIQAKIDRLAALGPAPTYIRADATNRESLATAYQTIKTHHGDIHGLVHAAIALLDKSLAQMDEARFKASLAAKVDVSVRMAQVFSQDSLDFVLFFSSMQSFSKTAGQGNYAAGCTFKDAFAHRLADAWSCPVRIMNWGYWGSVGIVASEAYRARMAKQGVGSIEPEAGMAALAQLLSAPAMQLAFIKATQPQSRLAAGQASEYVTLVAEQGPSLTESLSHRTERVFSVNETDAQDSQVYDDLQRLLFRLLFSQLQSIGLFVEHRPSISAWQQQIKLSAVYGRWLEESVRVLASHGYLMIEDGVIAVTNPTRLENAGVWAEWDERKHDWSKDPNLSAQVNLVDATLRALPAILTGKIPATDILFPSSSVGFVEGIYKRNPSADYFNAVLADTVVEFIEARLQQEPSARIRILEIGAGTGGTSEGVFKRLKSYEGSIAEYCYTDVSKAFLLHAQDRYSAANAYLKTAIFNVEQPLASQGIAIGAYDLLIAANVLHATKNIRHTLRNAKAALKKNGVLLLNEMAGNSLFSHLTFGLLEGWWLYEDVSLRIQGAPALSPESWQRVLHGEGFRSTFFPAEAAHGVGQQIIVSESDGLIRQGSRPTVELVQSPRSQPTLSSKTVAPSMALPAPLKQHIKDAIIAVLAESLRLDADSIDSDESFADYGLDSILGVRMVEQLKRALNIDINTTTLFDYSTVNKLTGYVVSTQAERVGQSMPKTARFSAVVQPSSPSAPAVEQVPRRALKEPARDNGLRSDFVPVANEMEFVGQRARESIAIIGMSGRFAKADTVEKLWEHLANGDNLVEKVSRWEVPQGGEACPNGGFLDRIDQFDPLFFSISGMEATYMDPQQRLFMEEAWQALEDAGYAGSNMDGYRCGVYVGYNGSDYQVLIADAAPAQAMWGGAASILSARIAYHLNLQGPAITIDTACSSSLVAMHLACQGLWNKETELALAGGVYVHCTPVFYAVASRAGMLSPSGHCHTFDDRADGFVPSEGVGAVVLKRVSAALADGDHIYGVIRGSGINQDGATNGITAPSALSQERLEREVYEAFHIHSEDIQLVEAHGTGTKLGDPIEWQALTKAFSKDTEKQQFCAIGSIKTNIGHTLAAAGIAGVIKILLALKHKQIPPSLHYEHGNSHIDFANTPFYVNTMLREWNVEQGKKRCAAVSSFGFSGTNAHLVIEEAPVAERSHAEQPGYLIVLSARSAEQLKEQAARLMRYCEDETIDCGNISYTLLLGRKHFNHRLACVVKQNAELVARLKQWLTKGKSAQVYASVVNEKENRDRVALTRYGNQCIDECRSGALDETYWENLSAIADLFVQGHCLDFEKLFVDAYCRVSLPTYPFAKERYWVEHSATETSLRRSKAGSALHPLVQTNTSTLEEQRFSSQFQGDEFYLSDHQVNGSKVLPGVAYLEMARAAVERSAGGGGAGRVVTLQNVVWVRPVVVNEAKEVHVGLYAAENDELEFKIFTAEQDAKGEEEEVHAQGRVVLQDSSSTATSEPIDLSLLRSQCDQVIDVAQCYAVYSAMGIEYGPAHRGLTSVQVGTDADGQRFVLAQVTLPACVSDTQDQYVLHPSVLDSALQASIGFSLGSAAQLSAGVNKAALPFALETLQILDRTPAVAMVVVRPRKTSRAPATSSIQKLDIDLCDESGRVCVRLKGFTSRVLETEPLRSIGVMEEDRTFLLTLHWAAKSLQAALPHPVEYGERCVFIDPLYKEYIAKLEAQSPALKWSVLPGEGSAVDRLIAAGEQVFLQVRSILQNKPKQAVLLQVLLGAEAECEEVTTALSGLLKSASLENPKFSGQVIVLSRSATVTELFHAANENACAAAKRDVEIRYVDGEREVTHYKELSTGVIATSSLPWKDDGVYLITGGGGGLGLIVAREIALQVSNAKIILTGRSPVSAAIQTAMQTVQDQGSETHIEYRQLDVSDANAVTLCINSVAEHYGVLNGIVHSAGVIKDSFIIKKTQEEFRAVLAPKVLGTVNLDHATKAMELDCFIVFSSISGIFGSVGQSDYALANAFMDGYVAYRNRLVQKHERHGRALSINWPLWVEGGMQVDSAAVERMRHHGIDTLTTAAGIDALYRAWRSDASQVVVLAGNRQLLQPLRDESAQSIAAVSTESMATSPDLTTIGAGVSKGELQDKTQQHLKKLLSGALKVPADRIEADVGLEKYGIDSILALKLVNELEVAFGSLSKTLLFEYQSIATLGEYFIERHREALIAHLKLTERALTTTRAPSGVARTAVTANVGNKRRRGRLASALREQHADQVQANAVIDIAIIGLSGRYPSANNVNEYWENLKAGKDCITEIPAERWDYREYFDPEKGKVGKSYSKWGGFIDGVDQFDPLFFNISPVEAQVMDPQERLFLQCVYQTLEDAGYTRETLKSYRASGLDGNVGVFVGVMYEEYQLYGAQAQTLGQPYALAGNPSSVANRVSYFCNFHGPSMAVDTMCSSSLTAIHLACQSLKHHGCEVAIAGGVNVSVHPNKYLALSQGQFASSSGRCESFGQGGDGYVPGEGVGAVLLKPLSQAVADQDHIYGVIKGTAINHGGKTNGYTVPNPQAQAQVIAQALKESKIDPRTISYIEAHGTGTSLGDPIEIAGLAKAFGEYTQDTQYCVIGSAKSNIGHLESAAGIAALTKVLLQMQHRILVPSLHSATLNPHIDFSRTPFKVQQTVEEWHRPLATINGQETEYPRIAGISSFGAGGANAHVIIEEYEVPDDALHAVEITLERPALILLSAKTEDRLQEQVKQLLAHVLTHPLIDADLAHLAYTLQIGREAMEHRLAFTAITMDELKQKLTACLAGKLAQGEIEECYRGEVRKNKEALSLFAGDEELQEGVNKWIQRGKYAKLLELWTKGLMLDWRQLYTDAIPKRLGLPAYPFSKERYWIEVLPQVVVQGGASRALHPLLQQNTSDLDEQRYSSTLTGNSFYLSDHIVNGNRVLPGVCYLEMARAAAQFSVRQSEGQGGVTLRNIVWQRPVIVSDEQAIHIGLNRTDDGEVEFEVYSVVQDGGSEPEEVIHAQGRVVAAESLSLDGVEPVDVPTLQSRCTRTIEASEIYAAFSAMGMEYGPAHRGLTSVQVGTDAAGQRFVLAQVTLPACVSDTQDQYVLHPSVLDSALQASLGLSLDQLAIASSEGEFKPALPFALERLEIFEGSPATGWVVVRPQAAVGSIQKLDIEIGDAAGRVCVRLQGFTSRVLESEVSREHKESLDRGIMLTVPSWAPKPLTESATAAKEEGERWVVVESIYKERVSALQAQCPAVNWTVLPKSETEETSLMAAAQQVFTQVQSILQSKPRQAVLLQVVLAEEVTSPMFTAALSGLLKSARQENPKFLGQVMALPSGATTEQIARAVEENASDADGAMEIRYVDGVREVGVLKELSESGVATQSPWKTGGVYLITGGAGGLGLIMAEEIASQVSHATLILTGRSSLSAAKQTQLETLKQRYAGTNFNYRLLDVGDADAVTNGIHAIVEQYGSLNGIVHSAGVIKDNFIIKKTSDEFRSVLAPKVLGTVNLDCATQSMALDCFILFSSNSGVFGNVGQSDYALANAFMDRYAAYRNQLIKTNHRQGRTLSINWPLWADGGMQVDDATQAAMRRQGFDVLATADGVAALYRAWSSDASQVVVLAGERQKLKQLVGLTALLSASVPHKEGPIAVAAISDSTTISRSELHDKTIQYLKKLLSGAMKLPADRIEADVGLEKYGIDSILALKLVNELEVAFGSLSKTLLFEYQSIATLGEYFIERHREALIAHLKLTERALTTTRAPSGVARTAVTANVGNKRRRGRLASALREQHADQVQANAVIDIAIIGLSGRYPSANNVNEYWENLKAGKDCITEIPAERWDYREYFDPEKGKVGKSYSKWGGFIDGVDQFDPLFFNISPVEAQVMDPQERLFLQCVYQTLEDAGYTRETLKSYRASGLDGNVGVFVGVMYEEYQLYGAQAQTLGQPYALAGNPSSVANRVSYFCNFHGPSMAVDTMCSSSLTAIHLACQSLKHHGCEVAIAGGVNVSVHPNKYLALSQGQFASSSGRCESFGQGGDGYVPGEGVGAVLLKPLSQAVADQDHIYGVIKGTAINHGGKTNGYTVPNPQAQAQVIAQALKESKIDPRTISYIEAHGTGTSLGDPIEIAGLAKAFGEYTQDTQYCVIGSAKSNIGHLESAAGIAALTKVLLQMQHRILVPSLHSATLNPHIDFSRTPFKVQQTVEEWHRPLATINGQETEYPRIAGISSFGAGGANAHVIIEEYEVPDDALHAVEITLERPALILLSAKTEDRLQEQVKQLLAHVLTHPLIDADLAHLAYTLQIGREAMEHRLAFTAITMDELKQKLTACLAGKLAQGEIEECYRGEVRKNKEALSLFAGNEELQEGIEKLVQRGKYAKLLELWVKGLAFDWAGSYREGYFYAEKKPNRISLPTYPFAKEQYWVPNDDLPKKLPLGDSQKHSFNNDELEELFEGLVADQVPQSIATEKLRLVLSV